MSVSVLEMKEAEDGGDAASKFPTPRNSLRQSIPHACNQAASSSTNLSRANWNSLKSLTDSSYLFSMNARLQNRVVVFVLDKLRESLTHGVICILDIMGWELS